MSQPRCYAERRLRSAGVSDEAVQIYRDGLVREADVSLAKLTAALPVPMLRVVELGDARVLINKRAEERGCTLIVTGMPISRSTPPQRKSASV